MATTVPMLAPDGTSGDVPISNVNAAKQAGFRVAVTMQSPDGKSGLCPGGQRFPTPWQAVSRWCRRAVPDAAKPSYWDALTNPIGSGGRQQGLLGGALQVGGQAIKTMAAPFIHPLDTLGGMAHIAGDAINQDPTAVGRDLIVPMVQQYIQDKQQGGHALALENLAGNLAGQVEGGRMVGGAISKVAAPVPNIPGENYTPVQLQAHTGLLGRMNGLGDNFIPQDNATSTLSAIRQAAADNPNLVAGKTATGPTGATAPGSTTNNIAAFQAILQKANSALEAPHAATLAKYAVRPSRSD
jgi:hypothetical protein